MAKKTKKTAFARDLEKSLQEVVAWAKGEIELPGRVFHPPKSIQVEPIRKKLGYSQQEFAHMFGLRVATIRDWEQGRRTPEGAARTLLAVIDKAPDVVRSVLEESTAAQNPS